MGSRSPEGHQQLPRDNTSREPATAIVHEPKTKFAPDDNIGGEGDDDDDDDDEDDNAIGAVTAVSSHPHGDEAQTPSTLAAKKRKKRSSKKKKPKSTQSTPPRVPVAKIFPRDAYPQGELVLPHAGSKASPEDWNLARTSQAELRQISNPLTPDVVRDFRKAAEVHRQVRKYAQEVARPGVELGWLAEEIESGVRALVDHQGLEKGDALNAGLAFPAGFSVNHVAAHWTPGPGSGWPFAHPPTIQKSDVVKIDFGVHVNGRIVDSAFTLSWEDRFDPLLAAVRAATNAGIKEAGIDARVCDISASIQEVMESYEVEINPGKLIPVKAVRSITGHDIKPYKIHGSKQIPFVKNNDQTKMEEGEVFAIETFGTTGKGILRDGAGVYGYGLNPDAPRVKLPLTSARSTLKTIEQNFGTIVFCRRYLERLGAEKYLLGLNSLVSNDILSMYPPLLEVEGSYVAQFEHTLLLKPDAKEVVSRGSDY